MYCKKCGKYIIGRREICDACREEMKNGGVVKNDVVTFHGTVATGIWQSLISLALAIVAMGVLIGAKAYYAYTCEVCQMVDGKVLDVYIQSYMKMSSDAKTLVALSCLLSLIGVGFGVAAVRMIFNAKRNNYVFPTATVISGSIALIYSLVILILSVITFNAMPFF